MNIFRCVKQYCDSNMYSNFIFDVQQHETPQSSSERVTSSVAQISNPIDFASKLLNNPDVSTIDGAKILKIEKQDIDTWTLILDERLKALFGTEYSTDHLFAALSEIKNRTFNGANLFEGMAKKINDEDSITFSFKDEVLKAIKDAAKERKVEQKIIKADWSAYLIQNTAKVLEPRNPEPISPPNSESPLKPGSNEIDPELERDIEMVKRYLETYEKVLKPGQAIGEILDFGKIDSIEIKADMGNNYIYKAPNNAIYVNGLTVVECLEFIRRHKNLPLFGRDDLKKVPTQLIDGAIFSAQRKIVDGQRDQSIKEQDKEYKDKTVDAEYFQRLSTIMESNKESTPQFHFEVPVMISGVKVNLFCLAFKTNNGYSVERIVILPPSEIYLSSKDNNSELYKQALPRYKDQIDAIIKSPKFSTIQALGEKILEMQRT